MSVRFRLVTRLVRKVRSLLPIWWRKSSTRRDSPPAKRRAEDGVGPLAHEDLDDAQDVPGVVLEVGVVDDRVLAVGPRQRGPDGGALAAVPLVAEEDPVGLAVASPAQLDGRDRRRCPARGAAGGGGASAIPALGREGGERAGRAVPGRVVHHHHLDALEVRARLQDREARERGRHQVLLVVDRDEDGEGRHGKHRSSAGPGRGRAATPRRHGLAPRRMAACASRSPSSRSAPARSEAPRPTCGRWCATCRTVAGEDELLLVLDRDLDREIEGRGLDEGGDAVRRARAGGAAHRRGLHALARPAERGGPRGGPSRRHPLPAAVDLPAPGARAGGAHGGGRPAPRPPRPLRPLRPDLSTEGLPAQPGAGRPGHRHQRVHPADARRSAAACRRGRAWSSRSGSNPARARDGVRSARGPRGRGRSSTARRRPGRTRGTTGCSRPSPSLRRSGRVEGPARPHRAAHAALGAGAPPARPQARDRGRRPPPGIRPARAGGGRSSARPARSSSRPATRGSAFPWSRRRRPEPGSSPPASRSSTRSGCRRENQVDFDDARARSQRRSSCRRRRGSLREPLSWREVARRTVEVLHDVGNHR